MRNSPVLAALAFALVAGAPAASQAQFTTTEEFAPLDLPIPEPPPPVFEAQSAGQERPKARELPNPLPLLINGERQGEFTVASTEGMVVLLDFWASWCGPCRTAMPKLNALHKKFAASGFAVVGINLGERESSVKDIIKEYKLAYPVALDRRSKSTRNFLLRGVPAMLLLDRKGRVVKLWMGFSPEIEADIAATVQKTVEE